MVIGKKFDSNKLLHETVLINFSCFMTTLDHKELVQCVCDLMDIEYKDKGPSQYKDRLIYTYGDFHVKDKKAVRTSYL